MKIALICSKTKITVSHTKEIEILDRYEKKCLVVSCGVYLLQDRLLNSDVLERCGIKSKKVLSSAGLLIALLEGMAYGKIPIVSRVPAIKEVLNDNNVGLWSDVKNEEQVVENMREVETNYEKLMVHGELALKIIKENIHGLRLSITI